jgi:hypothetical protein
VFKIAGGAQMAAISLFGFLIATTHTYLRIIDRFKYGKVFSRIKISLFQLLVILAASYSYTLGTLNRNFNGSDDFEGYFVFARKFNQLGTMGNEFFSERRLVSSVGGQSLIDSIFLQFLPIEYIHASDLGFGFLALIATVILFLRTRSWTKNQISLVILIICLINPMSANITSTYLLSLLIFALLVFVTDQKLQFRFKDQVIVAMIAVGGMTLKNSTTPFILGIVLLYSFLEIKKTRVTLSSKWRILSVYLVALILWIPWGFGLYLSCATFQYPLLGSGNHGSRYGTFNHSSDVFSLDFLRSLFGPIYYAPSYSIAMMFAALIAGYVLIESRRSKRDVIFILYGAFLLSALYIAITIGTSGYSNYRYVFPAILAFLVFVLQFMTKAKLLSLSIILLMCISFSFSQLAINKWGYASLVARFNPTVIAESNLPDREPQVEKIQNAILTHSKVLLRTSYNFMFDFRKNDYQIADFPGAVSPPPGIPNFGSSKDMYLYLVSQDIDYVVFQYSNLFDKESNSGRIAKDANSWLKAEALNAFAFHDRMMEISKILEVVYDDGETFALKMKKEKK